MELPGATTGAEEHLAFVEHLLSRYQFSPQQTATLRAEITDVRKRVNDPRLYMAVVGEASSGKSTFINALLEAPLLEMGSILEITAAATVITYGDALRVAIRLRPAATAPATNGRHPQHVEFLSDAAEAGALLTYGREHEPIRFPHPALSEPVDLETLIRKVTTVPDLARDVLSVHVTYPADFLGAQICVIDTPGLNAQIGDMEPKEVTQRAVAFADGAIILTRANQAMSQSLVTLLRNDLGLSDQIKRCAFLITKIDQIENEREHERIARHVRTVVQREFLPTGELPPVFFGAPKAILDALDGVPEALPRADHWREQFHALKTRLIDYLQRQRATVIAEKTLRLLNDLFFTLDSYLSERLTQFATERKQLEQAIIPDLSRFVLQEKQRCAATVEPVIIDAETQVRLKATQVRNNLLDEIENAIMAASSVPALKTYVEDKLPDLLQERVGALSATVEAQSATINQAARNATQQFEQRFYEAYEQLADVRRDLRWRGASEQSALDGPAHTGFGGSEAFQGPSVSTLMTGAVVGAMIGSIIPGVGTLFGAVLGSLASTFFGPSLADRKRTLWNSLRPQLSTELERITTAAQTSIADYGEATMRLLLRRIDEYAQEYREHVQAIRAEQAREAERLQQWQQTLESDKYAVAGRRELVQSQLDRLGTIRF